MPPNHIRCISRIPPGWQEGSFIRRLSCGVCVFVSRPFGARFPQYDREDFDLVSELEQKTGFTVTPDSALIQMISAPHSDETERSVGVISVARLLSQPEPSARCSYDNVATNSRLRLLFPESWRSAVGWLLQRYVLAFVR